MLRTSVTCGRGEVGQRVIRCACLDKGVKVDNPMCSKHIRQNGFMMTHCFWDGVFGQRLRRQVYPGAARGSWRQRVLAIHVKCTVAGESGQ